LIGSAAPLVDVLLESPTFMPILAQALSMAGIQPNSPAFQQFVDLARWQLDAADPINYALRLGGTFSVSSKLLVQIAEQDVVFPPARQRGLAVAASAMTNDLGTSGTAGHAVLVNPMDPGIMAAQTAMVQFLTN
jgi:hypothetical protein